MASSSEVPKRKGPVIDPAICRCCRSIKKCRILNAEYSWMGEKEIYSDMIMDCFGLLLSYLEGEEKDSCICATCVMRLREASAFRKQVLQAEEAFLNAKLGEDEHKWTTELQIKSEPVEAGGAGAACDNSMDAADDQVNNDSDSETKPLLVEIKPKKSKLAKLIKPKATKPKTSKSTMVTRKRLKEATEGAAGVKGSGAAADLKEQLLSDMKKIKSKLKEAEQAAPTQKKKKQTGTDHEHKAYANTVTIVRNSYVCPFHNRVSNYYCFYCRDQFTEPTELREHTLTHDTKDFIFMMDGKKLPKIDITRIDCRLCDAKITDLTEFKTHISTVHNKSIYHDVTNEFLKFRLTLNNLQCTECSSTFPYFDMLKKHMIEHFGTFTCDSCGACFLEQNSLLTHIRTHKRTNESTYPCEVCGKHLKNKYSMYLHVSTVHEKKPTVNCYKCEDSFLSYALRNRHLIEVHGDKRTFPCKLCDKVYNRRKTLMEHNRRNHLKVFRHQCTLCDQKFYLPSRLKEHMVTHTGERNFRCEYCNKSYPRLKSLREHVRTHTNDRRFKCDICNSTFTQNGSLKSHQKSHHQGLGLEGFS